MSKGLGRRKTIDLRNHAHPMRAAAAIIIGHKLWHAPPVLDQGDSPQCVAYATTAFLQCGPFVNNPPFPWTDPAGLYHAAQQNDEWPGEGYDGTSALGAMRVLSPAGYVKEYVWAYEAMEVVQWILQHGPVLIGTNWYETMFDVESSHWLRVHAEKNPAIAGGHETLLIGTDTAKKCPDGTVGAVRLQNSWGTSWGDGGRAWLSISDLSILLREGGDACTANELKHPKPITA